MEAEFWHDRWARGQIGFHGSRPHPLLVAHFDRLGLTLGARLFLPLCGKTLDIGWLLARGYRVAGAELSRVAIEQLFQELGVVPEIVQAGPLERFAAPGLDVFVGDVFDLTAEVLGPVDAVYDRAALIALPPGMRARYAAHVARITGGVPLLLIALEFDEPDENGPPFAVGAAEVAALYGRHEARLIEALPDGQGATDIVWLLHDV